MFTHKLLARNTTGKANTQLVVFLGIMAILLVAFSVALLRPGETPEPDAKPMKPIAKPVSTPDIEPPPAPTPPPPETPVAKDQPPKEEEDADGLSPRDLDLMARRFDKAIEEQAKLQEIAEESMEETIHNFLDKEQYGNNELFTRDMEAYFEDLAAQPRVAKVLQAAQDAAPEERARLLELVTYECDRILTELPLTPHEREYTYPTAEWPEGGIVLPYLLAELDISAGSLSLLVRLYERNQDALHITWSQYCTSED